MEATLPRWSQGRAVPAVAATALVAAVAMIAALGGAGSGDGERGDALLPPGANAMAAGPTAPTTTLPATTTTAPKTAIAEPLREGDSGAEVERLQQRLTDLGFQPGPIDGYFGDLTQASIWAYQKLVDGVDYREPDGVVTPAMWQALQDPLPLHARRPDAGKHTEIYLPEQALVVFDGDRPVFISHISSGDLEEPGDDFNQGQE